MTDSVHFRPIRNDDHPFLYEVYASTRAEELRSVPWSAAAKEEFLRMQFAAQHNYYQQHYGDASYAIILLRAQPIGRLYIDRRPGEIRIVDIALLQEYRGRGIGSRIMQDLLAEAAAAGKVVRIHVERDNLAMHLYNRLEFEKVKDAGVYDLMEWRPRDGAEYHGPSAGRD